MKISRQWIYSIIVIFIISIPWISSAIRDEKETIIIGGPITSIPEKYNEHPQKLLEDYQNKEISLYEVVQILILYQDRGEFKSLYETDTELDLYWIDKREHERIEQWNKEVYKKRSKE